MIWILMTSISILLSGKGDILLSELMILNNETKPMIMLSALTMLIMMKTSNTLKEKKKMSSNIIMASLMLSVLITLNSTKMIFFILGMEMTMIPLVILIAESAKNKDKMESLVFLMNMNSLGSILFMMIMIFLMKTSTEFQSITYMWMESKSELNNLLLLVISFVKMPILMAHLWLSKAHVSASGICSMILASILIKMGTLGIMKSAAISMLTMSTLMESWMSLSALSLISLTLIMTRYNDVKVMIATSSIVHMSSMTFMLTIYKESSVIPMIMMMTGHGVVSFYLFMMMAQFYQNSESRSSFLNKSKESSSKMVTLMSIVFVFSNMAMPPLINFMSELWTCSVTYLQSIMTVSMIILYMFLFIKIVMTFSVKIIYSMKENSEKSENKNYLKESIYLLIPSLSLMITF